MIQFIIICGIGLIAGISWVILKFNTRRKNRKQEHQEKTLLQRVLDEKWIPVSIKDTMYKISGITNVEHINTIKLDGLYGALDRQFSTHPTRTNYSYYYFIEAHLQVNEKNIVTESPVYSVDHKTLQMYCELGFFFIYVNPANLNETCWVISKETTN